MNNEKRNGPGNELDETSEGEQAGSRAQWSVSEVTAVLREGWQKVEYKPLIFLTMILAAGTIASGILVMLNANWGETRMVAFGVVLIGSGFFLCPSVTIFKARGIKWLIAFTVFMGIMFISNLWSLDRERLKPIGTYSYIPMVILFLAMMVSLLIRYRLVSRNHRTHSDT